MMTMLLKILLFLCYFCNIITSDRSRDLYENRLENNLSFLCYATANSTASFRNNLNLLLSDFTVKSAVNTFYNTTIDNTVYGYYMCRGDLTQNLCNTCMVNATKFASKANCDYTDGFFLSANCIFGYSNYSMYGQLEKYTTIGYDYIESNVTNYEEFNKTLSLTITSVINEAAFQSRLLPGFATKEGYVTGDEKIYSMAQCTPDIVGVNCSKCLTSAYSFLRISGNGAPGGIAYMGKCQLRYDNVSFYEIDGVNSSNGKGLRPNLICWCLLLFCVIVCVLHL